MNNTQRDQQSRGPCGFTLTELLVTISIAAFLLLAGVGLYWRMSRGFALRAAVSTVESTLRGARAFAVHERSPADVVLLPQPQDPFDPVFRLFALGKRTVSGWHLEPSQQDPDDGSRLKGALDQTATLTGTPTFVPGRIGRCLLFDGSVHLAVSSPYLDEVREGAFAEAHVRPDAAGLSRGDQLPILSKSDGTHSTFSLVLEYQPSDDGQEFFWLDGRVYNGSQTLGAHTAAILRAGEWAHVALEYTRDGRRDVLETPGVLLRVDGREVELYDDVSGSGALAANTAPLLIGAEGGARFRGRLDEVKVAALVATEVRKLPRNTEVRVDTGSSDGRIHFDHEGKLDPRVHGRVVRFRIESPSDQLRRTVQVNWLGGVEVGEQERTIDE